MATNVVKEEFVTIVPVGESRPPIRDPAFVTVLTVGAATGAAEVVVYRPRGARLGLGLKFEGGSAAAEKVRRLLVQSCAENSPAANATTPWGKLIPGDEILAIDSVSVSELTRIDCVRRLKDSDEKLKLLVRHLDTEDIGDAGMDITDSAPTIKQPEIVRPCLPPPVPPRKLGKKNSFKDKTSPQSVGEQNLCLSKEIQKQLLNDKDTKLAIQQAFSTTLNNKLSRKSSFDSHIHRQNKESIACLKKGSPEEVRRLVRRLSDGKTMPPEAEVYIDLLSNEWERCLALADAESDDTGSSISTVVDRLGSITSSVENSIPSTPIMQPKTIDIQKVLNCIENIDTNILKDITGNKFLENSLNIRTEKNSDKTVYTNGHTFNQSDNQDPQSIYDEKIYKDKPIPQNDKNNNAMPGRNITFINLDADDTFDVSDIKMETRQEKPTPMPRTSKSEHVIVDKEHKTTSLIDISENSTTDTLLTPTKKNCIESWLLRSEAEMNIKNDVDNIEETIAPEALPRLIDFVPKPQFKECGGEPCAVARPTTAPPPPPVEAREDGSGASLDTIGELDETADSSVTHKSIVANDKATEQKSSYDSSFWEDRVNKSDTEDKSLSNDESPLPTCPRQPPDGVETPSDILEKVSDATVSTRLPPRLPPTWPTTVRSRLSYSRSQDARSEASVKDKIAMFSHDRSTSTDLLDKCGTLPTRNTQSATKKSSATYMENYSDVKSLDRRLTKSQDNLDEVPRSYKLHSERPEALGALMNTNGSSNGNIINNRLCNLDTTPLFYGSTNILPSHAESTYAQPVYHARSASDDSGKSSHKSNLEYLIEQRKKSMSKLRGLMIPEAHAPIVDLPEIKVKNGVSTTFTLEPNTKNIQHKIKKNNIPRTIDLKETWKSNIFPNNIPKYSPAFKRKSLQLYTPSPLAKESTLKPKLNDNNYTSLDNKSKLIPLKPPRQSLDVKSSSEKVVSPMLSAKVPIIQAAKFSQKEFKSMLNDIRDCNNMEVKICTITDVVDSDNDSAMSSTQSSYRSSASSPLHNLDSIESDSSHLSPRISNYTSYTAIKAEIPAKPIVSKTFVEYEKRNVCRSVSSETNVSLSSSAGSAATSGSQASCSSLESSVPDSEKKRVSKVYNIDTINRRNILASAKCRSGRDVNLNSPVFESKFSHESAEKSSSPQHSASDRLSTLTSTVSAISNKGENRRRNKVIAESDSDTDNEVNIRQRKSEFKNTRLKRNSSSGSKCKATEVGTDTSRVIEDAPQVISERIIKEIKKAGLDNYPAISKTILPIKECNISISNNSKEIKKPEVISNLGDFDYSGNNSSDSVVNNKTTSLKNGKRETNCDTTEHDGVKVNTNTSYIVRLKKGTGTGVGLILAGGIDCEAKEVTVHRVLADSIALRAGLKRGARVRSINGFVMAGLTHAQSVAILKEQRSEIVIEIENEIKKTEHRALCGSDNESKVRHKSADASIQGVNDKERQKIEKVVTVVLEKAGGGAGLGFGLDGGRDSPRGDRPLTIKKLFAGGAAAQSGCVLVGAELLSANGQKMEGFTRTQAWAALKSLPVGPVSLVLRNPVSRNDS